jgi:hypothetical protein
MEYFNLNCWQWCVEALNYADTAGVNIRTYARVKVHFSGNFWWANSSYIKTLKELTEEAYEREVNRWDAEFWIGSNEPTMVQLWNSRVHHGESQYGPSNYADKSPRMYLFGRVVENELYKNK